MTDITVHLNSAIDGITEQMDILMTWIGDSHRSPEEMDWIQQCAKAVEDYDAIVHDLRRKISRIEEIQESIQLGVKDERAVRRKDGLRKLAIQVTQGMIGQNLLTLTAARKAGLVRVGERFRITLPDKTTFETDLCEPGNKFRERGRIAHFYASQKVEPEDKVFLYETAPGEWCLAASDPDPPVASVPTLSEALKARAMDVGNGASVATVKRTEKEP